MRVEFAAAKDMQQRAKQTRFCYHFEGIIVKTVTRTKMISTGPIVLRNVSRLRADGAHAPGSEPKRVRARAVKRILDKETGELVGWLYEWNTGSLVPRWKSEARENVIYE